MELRVLKYFRAVVEAGSITDAAKALHITQPTLSRQISQLEDEMGRALLMRGRNGIELTAPGVVLDRYARNIIALADRAEEEVALQSKGISGTVHIGGGETPAFSLLAEAAHRTRDKYPGVTFDVHDGPAADLMDNFVRGYYDILLDCESRGNSDYNQILLPIYDTWGIAMRSDDPLAQREAIRAEDLAGRSIIASPQGTNRSIGAWTGPWREQLDIAATYSLAYNAKFLVSAGVGVMFAYSLDAGMWESEGLCFRPLEPRLEARHKVLWRKTIPTKQTQAFLAELRDVCGTPPRDKRGIR